MYLPVPSTSVQLTFLMNSPYDPMFNPFRLHVHFRNVVNPDSIGTPLCNLNVISKYTELSHWSSREGTESSRRLAHVKN